MTMEDKTEYVELFNKTLLIIYKFFAKIVNDSTGKDANPIQSGFNDLSQAFL